MHVKVVIHSHLKINRPSVRYLPMRLSSQHTDQNIRAILTLFYCLHIAAIIATHAQAATNAAILLLHIQT